MGRGEMHVGLVGLGRERYVWIVTGAKVKSFPSTNTDGSSDLCDTRTLQSHRVSTLKACRTAEGERPDVASKSAQHSTPTRALSTKMQRTYMVYGPQSASRVAVGDSAINSQNIQAPTTPANGEGRRVTAGPRQRGRGMSVSLWHRRRRKAAIANLLYCDMKLALNGSATYSTPATRVSLSSPGAEMSVPWRRL